MVDNNIVIMCSQNIYLMQCDEIIQLANIPKRLCNIFEAFKKANPQIQEFKNCMYSFSTLRKFSLKIKSNSKCKFFDTNRIFYYGSEQGSF